MANLAHSASIWWRGWCVCMRWVGRLFSIMHDCLAQKSFIAVWGPVIHDIIRRRRQLSGWLAEGAARSTSEENRRVAWTRWRRGFQCPEGNRLKSRWDLLVFSAALPLFSDTFPCGIACQTYIQLVFSKTLLALTQGKWSHRTALFTKMDEVCHKIKNDSLLIVVH